MTNSPSELVLELIQRSKDKKKDTCFLTAYLPVTSFNLGEIQKLVKSKLLDEFRKHKEYMHYSEYHNLVVKELIDQLSSIKAVDKGLALFLKIRRSDLKYGLKKAYWKIYLLERGPKEEVNILDSFDVDQLVADIRYARESLIVTIDRKESKFYKLSKGRLEFLHSTGNSNSYTKGDDSSRNPAPRRNMEIYSGSGGKNVERIEKNLDQRFVGEVIDEIKNLANKNDVAKYLIVFYSSNFSEFREILEVEIRKHINQQFIIVGKDFGNEMEIKEEGIALVNSQVENNIRESVESLNNNIQQAAFGWEEVISVVRNKRVEILFLKPRLQKSGYLMNGQIFHKFTEGAEYVDNVVQFLVSDVIESGGEIIILDENMPTKENIFAKLRY